MPWSIAAVCETCHEPVTLLHVVSVPTVTDQRPNLFRLREVLREHETLKHGGKA